MGAITPALRQAVEQVGPAMVATANASGLVSLSPKGSLRVLDDDHLLFADLRSPRTLENLTENPCLSAAAFDPVSRRGWRIWGRASEIITSGELFEAWRAKYAAKGPLRHLVKVRVDSGQLF